MCWFHNDRCDATESGVTYYLSKHVVRPGPAWLYVVTDKRSIRREYGKIGLVVTAVILKLLGGGHRASHCREAVNDQAKNME